MMWPIMRTLTAVMDTGPDIKIPVTVPVNHAFITSGNMTPSQAVWAMCQKHLDDIGRCGFMDLETYVFYPTHRVREVVVGDEQPFTDE